MPGKAGRIVDNSSSPGRGICHTKARSVRTSSLLHFQDDGIFISKDSRPIYTLIFGELLHSFSIVHNALQLSNDDVAHIIFLKELQRRLDIHSGIEVIHVRDAIGDEVRGQDLFLLTLVPIPSDHSWQPGVDGIAISPLIQRYIPLHDDRRTAYMLKKES